jgi:hypothetical protein
LSQGDGIYATFGGREAEAWRADLFREAQNAHEAVRVSTTSTTQASGGGIQSRIDIPTFCDGLEDILDCLLGDGAFCGVRWRLWAGFRCDGYRAVLGYGQFPAVEKREFDARGFIRDDDFALFQNVALTKRA